jgi:hypothetical protein
LYLLLIFYYIDIMVLLGATSTVCGFAFYGGFVVTTLTIAYHSI